MPHSFQKPARLWDCGQSRDLIFPWGDGIEIHAVARIPDLGAPKGMLVVNSFDEVKNFSQTLINAGYGYSVLSEPSQNEEFHLDSFREMFIDWSGEPKYEPQWMK